MSNTLTLDPTPRRQAPVGGDTATRSSALEAFEALADGYTLDSIRRQAAAGRQAVWTAVAWESPLILACDVIPISYGELWSEESKRTEAIAESRFQMPVEFCSMVKCILGRLHLDRHGELRRLLYYGGSCEPVSVVFEMAKKEGYDVHCIDSVTAYKDEDISPATISFLVEELRKVAVWLTGKPIDEDRLEAEIKFKNEVSRKVRTILDLRLHAPFYLPSIPTVQLIMGATHFFGRPEEYNQILDRLIDELKAEAKVPTNRSYIPLVLNGMGGPQLCKAIEEANGVILGWGFMDAVDYSEDIPPLESLALSLLQTQLQGGMGDVAGSPYALRRIGIEEKVRETDAKGIISTAITGCPYGSIVQQSERVHFKKRGIPIMTLEHTVHNEPLTEEQVMKVQTFIEMLS
jgi:benzoyl-CoA reductase/2-hydroxyglutaryl-CoA dehydratase subunit BcrC/BadD/HgdB